MTTIYYDQDADTEILRGSRIAILGYGNQGSAQARNLRDSGLDVIVGNVDDSYRERALEDGFEVVPIAAASARADMLFLLTPDEVMPEVYRTDVAPHLKPGKLIDFAHGYNIAFGLIEPPAFVDVVFVAPRMIGAGVRDSYLSGEGFPTSLKAEVTRVNAAGPVVKVELFAEDFALPLIVALAPERY